MNRQFRISTYAIGNGVWKPLLISSSPLMYAFLVELNCEMCKCQS